MVLAGEVTDVLQLKELRSEKFGVGLTPIAKSTTGVAEASFVENVGGTDINVDSTAGGYTFQQVVKALQLMGVLT